MADLRTMYSINHIVKSALKMITDQHHHKIFFPDIDFSLNSLKEICTFDTLNHFRASAKIFS